MPLEIHEIEETISLADLFERDVKGFCLDRVHPTCIEVDGVAIPVDKWPSTIIDSGTDVKVFPEARASAAVVAAWAAVALAAISIVMVLTMPKAKTSKQQQGDDLDAATATGNYAKLNSPIREVLGMAKVYPDLLVPPVTRFVNKRTMVTTLAMSVSRGILRFRRAHGRWATHHLPRSAQTLTTRFTGLEHRLREILALEIGIRQKR